MAVTALSPDVFISYAHLDNNPLTENQQGWVTRFHKSLDAMLSMRLGRKAAIWRDQKLQGSDTFSDEIVGQFSRAALLLSVLTPRYVESEWCTREAREFCSLAEKGLGVRVENKCRLIKVIKTPVTTEEPLPSIMQQILGYRFYTLADDEVPMELDPIYGEDLAQEYCRQMGKLAWELAQMLKLLEAQAPHGEKHASEPDTSKPTVYLAECSFDRREVREALELELRHHGYDVLPDLPLPKTETEYVAEVQKLLARCELSVHLVGAGYGAVPDGPGEKSEVILQNELAIQNAKSGKLRRIIWLPEGTCSRHEMQQQFITALHRDAEAQFGADLITSDLESLKAAVHAALKKKAEPPAPCVESAADGPCPRSVYVICDARDRKDSIPLRKFLKGRGFDVTIPVFEGDAAARRQQHEETLSHCDAIVLFYGAGDEAWKRAVENDLRKSRGYREKKPLPVTYTYLAAPVTTEKEELIELEEPHLIDGLGGFAEAAMEGLLRGLEEVR